MPNHHALDAQTWFWILMAIHASGLVSAVLARASIGCRSQRPCQWLFMGCLALVGLGVVVSMGISAATWLLSASSLAVMILAAVCDFSRPRRHEPA